MSTMEQIDEQIKQKKVEIERWEKNLEEKNKDEAYWNRHLKRLDDDLTDLRESRRIKEQSELLRSGPVTAVGVGGDQNQDNLVQTLTQAATQAATQAVKNEMIGMKKDVMKDVMKELKVVIGSVQVPINSTMNLRDSSISPIGKENKSNNEISDGENSAAKQHQNTMESDMSYRDKTIDISSANATRLGLGESKKDRKDPI